MKRFGIALAAVMTGLVPYTLLGTDEPVVTAVAAHPTLGWLRVVVEIGALIGLSSVVPEQAGCRAPPTPAGNALRDVDQVLAGQWRRPAKTR